MISSAIPTPFLLVHPSIASTYTPPSFPSPSISTPPYSCACARSLWSSPSSLFRVVGSYSGFLLRPGFHQDPPPCAFILPPPLFFLLAVNTVAFRLPRLPFCPVSLHSHPLGLLFSPRTQDTGASLVGAPDANCNRCASVPFNPPVSPSFFYMSSDYVEDDGRINNSPCVYTALPV